MKPSPIPDPKPLPESPPPLTELRKVTIHRDGLPYEVFEIDFLLGEKLMLKNCPLALHDTSVFLAIVNTMMASEISCADATAICKHIREQVLAKEQHEKKHG